MLKAVKQQPLHIEITEEESDTMCSMRDECERESDVSTLRHKLHLLKYYLKGFFSSTHTNIEYQPDHVLLKTNNSLYLCV